MVYLRRTIYKTFYHHFPLKHMYYFRTSLIAPYKDILHSLNVLQINGTDWKLSK